jgi:hypothetical protein
MYHLSFERVDVRLAGKYPAKFELGVLVDPPLHVLLLVDGQRLPQAGQRGVDRVVDFVVGLLRRELL